MKTIERVPALITIIFIQLVVIILLSVDVEVDKNLVSDTSQTIIKK